jgi:hypothetical protein
MPMTATAPAEHWMDEPEDHDFPAARSYLSLLVDPDEAERLVHKLRAQDDLHRFAAKDILRASGLPSLPLDDPEVSLDLAKVKAGKLLSPALLVRGSPMWIADGYHRVCVSYHIDPKTMVPCRVVSRS